jgi:hypothetical protein
MGHGPIGYLIAGRPGAGVALTIERGRRANRR